MLLSNDSSQWNMDDRAVYSILGTRVQLGITTSFYLASDLVSSAYSNLVSFEQYQYKNDVGIVIQTTFMPDPVCAALAMGLMVPEWQLMNINQYESYSGKDRSFWSRKAMECFAKKLCIPEKGNIGEIMVALYMLFCGDVLRMEGDRTLRTFSVLLEEWYKIMKRPHLDVNQVKCVVRSTSKMEVSFIQVCRNYFRDHGWNSSESLKWMYNAAVGTYVFSNSEAIDIVSAIRVTSSDGEITYHPLLVSVKCRRMYPTEIESLFNDVKNLLEDVRKKQRNHIKALCLLVVIGKTPKKNAYDVDDLGNFPHEDIYRLISVPANDPFDISKNVLQTTEAHEVAEIYASYPFLYTKQPHQINSHDVQSQDVTEKTKAVTKAVLRKPPSEVAKLFVQNLLGMFFAKKEG
jgi:hypothetical protein